MKSRDHAANMLFYVFEIVFYLNTAYTITTCAGIESIFGTVVLYLRISRDGRPFVIGVRRFGKGTKEKKRLAPYVLDKMKILGPRR